MFPTDTTQRQGSVTFGEALGSREGEPLTLGKPSPCAHCGDVAAPHQSCTPKGRTMLAYYPSDTCCQDRAREIINLNQTWARKYRASNLKGDHEEAMELEERNREITRIMRARGL